jgi:mannan endo-1,4-beta-mannosidase
MQFALDGRAFPVVGVNCYFLGYCSDSSRRSVMDAALRMGANVIRSWAFLDAGPRPPGGVAFQYFENGKVVQDAGPDGLERLDCLIAMAEDCGLRLILPLVNYWKDFGGMPQYLNWLGLDGPVEEFYRSPEARVAYRDWVECVLTRRNTRTGRLYSGEPAIMAWELANEPRCEAARGCDLLLDWIAEMSAFVKSLDSGHLLAAGDEGFLPDILDVADIDFGTYHLYPSAMGRGNEFGDIWIKDHVQSAASAGKPTILEEYGLQSPADRDQWYPRWLESVDRHGGAGDLLWMLGSAEPDVSGFRDAYTVFDVSEVPAIAEHSRAMLNPGSPST